MKIINKIRYWLINKLLTEEEQYMFIEVGYFQVQKKEKLKVNTLTCNSGVESDINIWSKFLDNAVRPNFNNELWN